MPLTEGTIRDIFLPDAISNDPLQLRRLVVETEGENTVVFVNYGDCQYRMVVREFYVAAADTTDARCTVQIDWASDEEYTGFECELTWLLQTLAVKGSVGAPPLFHSHNHRYHNALVLRQYHVYEAELAATAAVLTFPPAAPQLLHH